MSEVQDAPEVVTEETPEVVTEAVETPEIVENEEQKPEGGGDGEPVQPETLEDDDLEEYEFEGKKAKIPPEFKAALLRQADYTQKTQQLAEARKALDAQRAQQAESFDAFKAEHIKVAGLEGRVTELAATRDQYRDLDWNALREQDARDGTDLYDQYRANQRAVRDALIDTQESLDAARGDLKTKEAERGEKLKSDVLEGFRQTIATLQDPATGIPGWSNDTAVQIEALVGKEFGITTEDLLQTHDPRAWKVLHALLTEKSENARLKAELKKQTTATIVKKQTEVTPAVTTKGGSFTGAGVHDNLPTQEWMRRREADAAKKRASG